MGPNSSSSLSLMPRAARLAQPVNVFVVCVVDSFMMVLLSQVSYSSRGMLHHLLFGKSFSFGSILPLLWTKFRYEVHIPGHSRRLDCAAQRTGVCSGVTSRSGDRRLGYAGPTGRAHLQSTACLATAARDRE